MQEMPNISKRYVSEVKIGKKKDIKEETMLKFKEIVVKSVQEQMKSSIQSLLARLKWIQKLLVPHVMLLRSKIILLRIIIIIFLEVDFVKNE